VRLSGTTEGDHSGPFDIDGPTIGNLDQDLLDAIQAAARDAQDDGVTMVVTSGDYVVRSVGGPHGCWARRRRDDLRSLSGSWCWRRSAYLS
jgi:hypothetical protein